MSVDCFHFCWLTAGQFCTETDTVCAWHSNGCLRQFCCLQVRFDDLAKCVIFLVSIVYFSTSIVLLSGLFSKDFYMIYNLFLFHMLVLLRWRENMERWANKHLFLGQFQTFNLQIPLKWTQHWCDSKRNKSPMFLCISKLLGNAHDTP